MKTQTPPAAPSRTSAKSAPKWIFHVLYALALLSGVWGVIDGDFMFACSQWGIALIFDPFDEQVNLFKRPRWQQAWTITHLLLVLAAFIAGLLF